MKVARFWRPFRLLGSSRHRGQIPFSSILSLGSPITFAVDGRQYIAITSKGGAIAATQIAITPEADSISAGNAVYVFALPQ